MSARVRRLVKGEAGEIGLRVYDLIDGKRTAEEIMNITGLGETRLVDILDIFVEQGIICLEHPKVKIRSSHA